jgi:hypothetical protein
VKNRGVRRTKAVTRTRYIDFRRTAKLRRHAKTKYHRGRTSVTRLGSVGRPDRERIRVRRGRERAGEESDWENDSEHNVDDLGIRWVAEGKVTREWIGEVEGRRGMRRLWGRLASTYKPGDPPLVTSQIVIHSRSIVTRKRGELLSKVCLYMYIISNETTNGSG